MNLDQKPIYRMSLSSNAIVNPRWEILENENKKERFDSQEWKLCKVFAQQQDKHCNPNDIWYVKVQFIDINKKSADIDGYKEHVLPDYIPLWCLTGRKQDSLIMFNLSDELQIGVLCDQRSAPFYNKNKYEDEDPYRNIDPFVATLHDAIYQRISNPYIIDYKKEEEHRIDCQIKIFETLDRMFNPSK